jgi:hypothetical protein
LASRSCKNHWEKHLWAFVKVVEGSEIYNFDIHRLVHFSSNFGRKSCVKEPKPAKPALSRALALPRARARHTRRAAVPLCAAIRAYWGGPRPTVRAPHPSGCTLRPRGAPAIATRAHRWLTVGLSASLPVVCACWGQDVVRAH